LLFDEKQAGVSPFEISFFTYFFDEKQAGVTPFGIIFCLLF